MPASRLPYKFLLLLLLFSVVLIVPYSLVTYHDSTRMLDRIEDIAPLSIEQRNVHEKYVDDLTENFVSMSFYIFIIAFILSLFFSRKFIVPVKKLHRAAQSIKEGDFDVRLDVTTGDELAEVARAFNEMTETLKKKTTELMRKELYVSTMNDPLWVANEDNFIVDINPAFTELFGYERDEVVGSSVFDFLDEESDRVMREQIRERGRGESSTYEISIISKNEGLVPVLVSGAPIIEEGEVIGKIGIIKDFRREKALRDALRDEMDFTEAIMQSMSDSLLVIDKDFRIVKANMAAIAHAGRDIVGEYCHEVLHSRSERCYIHGEVCPAMTVFQTGRSFKTVHTHVESGVTVFHDTTAYPIRDRYGEVRFVVEVLRDVTEGKKLDNEIAQKNKELIALNSISRILSQSLRAEDIFNNILDKVTELTGMDGGGIYLMDELGKNLEYKYHRGLSDDFMRSVGRIKLGEGMPGKVALTGQSIVVPDISKSETVGKVLRHSGIKGYACTPVKGKEKMLGVFYIFSFEPHVFTPEEERILNSVGEMMGLALENIRLYEKMRDLYEHQRMSREEQQKNLLSLTSMLSATLDMKSVLEACLTFVKDWSMADFVWLLETDEAGHLHVMAASEAGISDEATVYQSGLNTIEQAAIGSREPVVYSMLDTSAGYHIAEGMKQYNTACAIPIHIGEKTLGALTLYFKMLREVREEDIHFFRTVASILAVAMERAKLYEDVIMERGMASTILEGIADGVMTVNMYGTVISMNKAAEEVIGILPRSAVAMKRDDVFSYSEENEKLQTEMAKSFDEATKGTLSTREADLVDISGRRLPLMFKSAPVRDNRGDIGGVVYVLRDMSREKQLDMLKTEFVKAVSHEFRTPLASIVGMAEMVLEEDVTGEKAREYLGAILSESDRLSALVSDVLDVARIESGKEIYTETVIDFNEFVRSVEEAFEPVIRKKKIKFFTEVDEAAEGYRGDEEKLKHMLRNIVDNALTYSDSGKKVHVGVHKYGETVKIVVKDEGWGIQEEDLRHAGEKFYRGAHAVDTTGTGLGLSIAREIVKMHGGSLDIESKPGEGTTVTVELPSRRKA
jgi:PAS domain S-box-containing protein